MNNYLVSPTEWAALSIFEQMGNIYSEVGRTFIAQKAGDTARAEAGMVRAMDLFDATTLGLQASKSPKLKEVLRVKELFAGEYLNQAATTLDQYFMQFALVARSQR
jgi:hypothetical protein